MGLYTPTTEKGLYTAMAALVFAYVAIRSFTVGLGNDEAATFFTFVHTGDFVPFVADYWSANNHFLNTLLTWLGYTVFGVFEWSLRLPNLLAFAAFLFFIFKIGQRLGTIYLRWLFWLLILSAHYLIEFFGYSRGYGLSIAFLMGGIHYLLLSQELPKKNPTILFKGLALMAMAMFANLNLVVSYLIWLVLAQWPLWENCKWAKALVFNFIALIPASMAVVVSFALRSKEELYIGQASLVQTFKTLMIRFADASGNAPTVLLLLFVGAACLAAAILLSKKPFGKFKLTPLLTFLAFFGLNLLAVQVMYWWLHVLFPTERTALHWLPLFAGLLVFTLDALPGMTKKMTTVASAALLSGIPLFGISTANFRVSSDPLWAREQIPDEFYFAVQEESSQNGFPPSLATSHGFYTVTWAFKNLKFKGSLGGCHEFYFKKPQYVADYAILNLKEFQGFSVLYDTLLHDKPTGMTLLKRKNLLQKETIGSREIAFTEKSTNEWTLLAEAAIGDSLRHQALRADYDLLIKSPKHPLVGLITLELRDSAQKVLHYDNFRIDYFKTDFSDDRHIRTSLLLDSIPAGTQTIRTLYWNVKSGPFALNSSRVDFYQLIEN